jgi:hypothetical protein
MAEDKPPPEFMSALGTEYFVLQSTASSTIGESGSRVSIYLSALASGLVAIGFASSSPRAFASLAFTVLPTVFVLGWFTIVRLIDTSVANIISLRRMELIRRYYAALAPVAPPYFATDNAPTGDHGVRYGRWAFLFTMASMVIVVNCVVGGATIALLFDLAFKVPLPRPLLSIPRKHTKFHGILSMSSAVRGSSPAARASLPLPENQPKWKLPPAGR